MRTARLAAGRPGACRKSRLDTLSNETRFTGLSFEKAAARGSARRARLRRTLRTFASRAVFSPTYTPPEKMIPIFFALASANSARLSFPLQPSAEHVFRQSGGQPALRRAVRLYFILRRLPVMDSTARRNTRVCATDARSKAKSGRP